MPDETRSDSTETSPAVIDYAGPATRRRFVWVWCHFFRNFFVTAGSAGVIGCLVDFPNQGSWVVGAAVCYATAVGFHFWHASICTADRRPD